MPHTILNEQSHEADTNSFWQGDVEGTWFKRVRDGRDRLFLRYGAGTSFGDSPLIETFFLAGRCGLVR